MLDSSAFYAGVPVFSHFAALMEPDLYRPVPDSWQVGVADVANSTQAIAAGRYKVVNTAGAAVVAAVANALKGRAFPFVFGGDGASFAVGPEDETRAGEALAATAAWARDDLELELRVALVPVAAIREAGFDLRVARFAPSPHVSYAMFSGGGLSWANRAIKEGRFGLPAAPFGARPDLSGLSCRWEEIGATRGVILSLLLVPRRDGEDPGFRALVEDLLVGIEDTPEAARPLHRDRLKLRWMPGGLDLEARATRRAGGSLLARKAALWGRVLASILVFRSGLRVGRFDPGVYLHDLVENSDFRKYDDGLRMTLDCTPAFASRMETRLRQAEADGIASFGLHRQSTAVLTCITPSVHERNHVHFIDGASGGYALAAAALKERTGLPA